MVIFQSNGLKLVVPRASFNQTINVYMKWTTTGITGSIPSLQCGLCLWT